MIFELMLKSMSIIFTFQILDFDEFLALSVHLLKRAGVTQHNLSN